jgi:hypothetical protein
VARLTLIMPRPVQFHGTFVHRRVAEAALQTIQLFSMKRVNEEVWVAAAGGTSLRRLLFPSLSEHCRDQKQRKRRSDSKNQLPLKPRLSAHWRQYLHVSPA